LLDRGAKVDTVNQWKYTALNIAASNGKLLVVKLLVERGADVRLKDMYGQTAAESARERAGINIFREEGISVADWLDSVSRV
jgi:ankyrin repeat protein